MPMSITQSSVDSNSSAHLLGGTERLESIINPTPTRPGDYFRALLGLSGSTQSPAPVVTDAQTPSPLGSAQSISQVTTDPQKSSRNSLKNLLQKERLQSYAGFENVVHRPVYVFGRTLDSGVRTGDPGEFSVFSTGGKPFDPRSGVNIDYEIKVAKSGNITITKNDSDNQDRTVQIKGSLDFSLDKDGKIKVNVRSESGKLAPIEQFFNLPSASQPSRP